MKFQKTKNPEKGEEGGREGGREGRREGGRKGYLQIKNQPSINFLIS